MFECSAWLSVSGNIAERHRESLCVLVNAGTSYRIEGFTALSRGTFRLTDETGNGEERLYQMKTQRTKCPVWRSIRLLFGSTFGGNFCGGCEDRHMQWCSATDYGGHGLDRRRAFCRLSVSDICRYNASVTDGVNGASRQV
jgi:hypothetical protein